MTPRRTVVSRARSVLPALGAGLAAALFVATPLAAQPSVLDDFETSGAWTAAPADGVTLDLSADRSTDGPCLRLDYDFQGHGGWAAAHRKLKLELAPNWELAFRLRGAPATQTLEVKLLDPSGENVWWSVRRDLAIGEAWQRIVVKKRQISFAWGPAGGGELERAGSIEIAVVAGDGGKGTVWIDDLTYTPLEPPHPYRGTPKATASSSAPGHEPRLAVDGDPATTWRGAGAAGPRWLQVDFGERRELGGLVVDWDPDAAPGSFEVQTSRDGADWTTGWRVSNAHGRRSRVFLPETDCRLVRLLAAPKPGGEIGIREIEVVPVERWATANDLLADVARDSRRGLYPRGLLGEPSSWTVTGPSPGGSRRGLLGADGAFEPAARSFSLEPFVLLDGRLLTWADVASSQSLMDGRLPIPTVTWATPELRLEVTVLAAADLTSVRYRLTNRSAHRIDPRLLLAARPFQVNPPSQILNVPGGAARGPGIWCTRSGLEVDGWWQAVAFPAPITCGATGFDDGDVVSFLDRATVPDRTEARGLPYPSGVLAWERTVAPEETLEVTVAFSAADGGATPVAGEAARGPEAFTRRLDHTARAWRESLSHVEITVPPAGRDALDTMTANLAFMLINRDGPALQPGARSYARSWIRDGTMMATALLRLGHETEVEEFARWYAAHQYADGRVPCCIDPRGADPVVENDADGELIFLIAETVRITRDTAFAAELWPHALRAAGHIDALRRQRRTDAYRAPVRRVFFGLLPESISHEGYSARPMHSYWDDFWALRGLSDAAWLARELGMAEADKLVASEQELRADLLASLKRTMQVHDIDYIPGCAELGDFDATSTTVAVSPTAIDAVLPQDPLMRTFERYWEVFTARRDGAVAWQNYTPYELRTVGVFVRLGWRERAWSLLDAFLRDRLPPGWRQWPEIVWRDAQTARFLGDLPHSWVGSDFVRSFLDVFAWERERDQALVVAGGVPAAWMHDGGVAVRDLRTRWGRLSYALREDAGVVRLTLGPGLEAPPGGIVLQVPLANPPVSVTVNGVPVSVGDGAEIVVREAPAEVEIRLVTKEGRPT